MTSPRPRLAPAPSLSVPSRSRFPSKVIKARNGTRKKARFSRSDARSASSLVRPIGNRSHPPRASYLRLATWSMTQRLTLMLSTVFLQTSPTSPTVNLFLVPLPCTTVNPCDQSEPQSDQLPTVSDSQAARSEPPNSGDDEDDVSHQYLFQLPSLSSRRLPIAAYSLMADRLNTSSRMQHITGHRRRTISVNDIHDCLLELWGGLPAAPEAFDAARRAIHEYMVTGH